MSGPRGDQRVEELGEQLRDDPEQKHQHDERNERRVLDSGQVRKLSESRGAARTVENSLPKCEQEQRRAEQAEASDRRGPRGESEYAAENQELADESVQPRQPERGEQRDAAQSGEDRSSRPHAAEISKRAPAVSARFENPHAEEERG